jgi:hypothetical protein
MGGAFYRFTRVSVVPADAVKQKPLADAEKCVVKARVFGSHEEDSCSRSSLS